MFAVPTTLPPNSSRHNRMFSPNKEAELFRQQLDSISVRRSSVWSMSFLDTVRSPSSPSLQMQSEFFISRQRKSRSRQLRKPLVVQVRGQRKETETINGLFVEILTPDCSNACFSYSGHSYPELQEIPVSTSAPSLSSPTPLPQVNIKSVEIMLKTKHFISVFF